MPTSRTPGRPGEPQHSWCKLVQTARVLPDYSWPVHMPLEHLRRLIEHESDDALQELAQAGLPRP